MHQNKKHIPVLLDQVLLYLDPKEGESYLDLTAGYGGHAREVLGRTKNPDQAILIDRDPSAVAVLKKQFARSAEIFQEDFYSASRRLVESDQKFDLMLADLGVSSPHLNEPSRGFSLQHEGPLDMRMDQSQKLDANAVVNTYGETALAELIKTYGEEPKARLIAKLIVSNRPVETTTQLANIVAQAWRGHSRVHPATRTFQAIRIAVNDELSTLKSSLPLWLDMLSPGGRIVVISFHSLEDRLVKQAFAKESGNRYDATIELLTRRPVMSEPSELVFNPRARSAKLRAAVKINKRKGSFDAYSG
jgi:16S rRNA (cytosine1402-N4)-methyltransferase